MSGQAGSRDILQFIDRGMKGKNVPHPVTYGKASDVSAGGFGREAATNVVGCNACRAHRARDIPVEMAADQWEVHAEQLMSRKPKRVSPERAAPGRPWPPRHLAIHGLQGYREGMCATGDDGQDALVLRQAGRPTEFVAEARGQPFSA